MSAEFFTNLAAIAVGGFVLWGLWRAAQPRPVFEVHLLDGTLQVKVGRVTPAFLQTIEEIAEASQLSEAIISGFSKRKPDSAWLLSGRAQRVSAAIAQLVG